MNTKYPRWAKEQHNFKLGSFLWIKEYLDSDEEDWQPGIFISLQHKFHYKVYNIIKMKFQVRDYDYIVSEKILNND